MVAAATVVASCALRIVLDAIPSPTSEVPILASTSAAGAAFSLHALPMKRVATRDNGDRRGDFGCEQSNKRTRQDARHVSLASLPLTHPASRISWLLFLHSLQLSRVPHFCFTPPPRTKDAGIGSHAAFRIPLLCCAARPLTAFPLSEQHTLLGCLLLVRGYAIVTDLGRAVVFLPACLLLSHLLFPCSSIGLPQRNNHAGARCGSGRGAAEEGRPHSLATRQLRRPNYRRSRRSREFPRLNRIRPCAARLTVPVPGILLGLYSQAETQLPRLARYPRGVRLQDPPARCHH